MSTPDFNRFTPETLPFYQDRSITIVGYTGEPRQVMARVYNDLYALHHAVLMVGLDLSCTSVTVMVGTGYELAAYSSFEVAQNFVLELIREYGDLRPLFERGVQGRAACTQAEQELIEYIQKRRRHEAFIENDNGTGSL